MMRNRALVALLSCLLVLDGCGAPAQTSTSAETSVSQETAQSVDDNRKISDATFVENLQDDVYNLITDGLDENGDSEEYEVQEVKAVYLSKEYIEQYSSNSKETKFFGSTLGELEAKFGDQKYVFDIGEDGKTVCHAVDDFDNTFDQVNKVAILGAGVIIISVTIACVATGGVPVTSLIACTGAGAKAIAANKAQIAILATKSAVAIAENDSVEDAAKDIVFDAGGDFVIQAIEGTVTA